MRSLAFALVFVLAACSQEGNTAWAPEGNVRLVCGVPTALGMVETYHSPPQPWIKYYRGEYSNKTFSYVKSNQESCSVEEIP